jgi:hypothetical protein
MAINHGFASSVPGIMTASMTQPFSKGNEGIFFCILPFVNVGNM